MPLVYIHGVNARDTGPTSKYGELRAHIADQLQELVLKPCKLELEMLFPNWGQYAVSFSYYERGYGLLTIPSIDEEDVRRELAVLGGDRDAEAAEIERQVLQLLDNPTIAERVLNAPSDVSAAEHLAALVAPYFPQPPTPSSDAPATLGAVSDALNGVGNRLLRAVTTAVIRRRRQAAQRNASRFMADAFVYARDRGTREAPGDIIKEVLRALRTPRSADEPLVVVTHSMGGNILYDILTTYAPELEVDCWIAIGSQVGHFEDMKLFAASDRSIKHPQKVAKPPRLKRWLNVLDRGDVIGFLAAPVFDGVDDVFYSTGESIFTAHGAYFHQPDFYKLLAKLLGRAVPAWRAPAR